MGANVSHTYSAPGSYTVELQVLYSIGFSVACTATQKVNQVPSCAVSSLFPTVTAGGVAGFDGSASFDPDGTIVDYAWDFGDGTSVSGPSTIPHVYAAPGTYTVTLTVTDDDGGSSSCSLLQTVLP